MGGYKHPDDLLSDLTATQWQEWQLYYDAEPFGEDQQFLQTGIIASTIANWSGKSMKKGASISPQDFMPYHKEIKTKQTPGEMKNIFKAVLKTQKRK